MMMLLFIALAAPAVYWVLGAPLALWMAGPRFGGYAPILGVVVAGLTSELAVIIGIPSRWLLVAVVASQTALVLLFRERFSEGHRWSEVAAAYAVALFAASVSPFPVLGSWSGDWLHAYDMGQALSAGVLPASMLARPPLFGGAMLPLQLFVDDLGSLQVMAAVASAGAALAALELGTALFRREAQPVLLVPLLLSMFFLHQTAAAWSKLLAGGLLLLSWAQTFDTARGRWRSALLFGAAVATHEGAIVWGLLNLLLLARPARLSALVKEGARLAVATLLIAGPFLAWTLIRYGFAARVAANPVITDAAADPLPVRASLIALSTFVPWSPFTVLARWLSGPSPFSGAVAAKEAYWLVTSTVTLLAGTFLGLLLPALLALRPKGLAQSLEPLRSDRAAWLYGFVFATLLASVLAPFPSGDGCMQNAHAPFALLLLVLWSQYALDQLRMKQLAVATALLGVVPFALLNGAVSAGLRLSPAFEARMRAGSEGDYQHVLEASVSPLGLSTFPFVALLAVAMLGAVLYLTRLRVEPRLA